MLRKSITYLFWTPPLHFFQERMDAHFFGRALSRSHMAFFRPFYGVLDAFLKKRIALSIRKSYVRCWRKDRKFSIKFNVIELYVVKSWWKIKFNKRKLYHQLICFFFYLFFFFFFQIKPALKHLGKLDYVVTELLLRKKK